MLCHDFLISVVLKLRDSIIIILLFADVNVERFFLQTIFHFIGIIGSKGSAGCCFCSFFVMVLLCMRQ